MSKTTRTDLVCPECGNVFPIMRLTKHQKELFHRKKLYCFICQKETNHIEVKDHDLYTAAIRFKKIEDLSEPEKVVFQLVKRRSERSDS